MNMRVRIGISQGLAHLGRGVGIAASLLVAGSTHATASEPRLAGTWGVQVTLRACDPPQAPIGAPFNSVVTFHAGGTISESTSSGAFAIGQRTPGHGVWEREGRHSYSQRMLALVLFKTDPGPNGPGFEAGWQTITQTVRLLDDDNFTSSGTNGFFRLDGTQYRGGCSTAVGHRFE